MPSHRMTIFENLDLFFFVAHTKMMKHNLKEAENHQCTTDTSEQWHRLNRCWEDGCASETKSLQVELPSLFYLLFKQCCIYFLLILCSENVVEHVSSSIKFLLIGSLWRPLKWTRHKKSVITSRFSRRDDHLPLRAASAFPADHRLKPPVDQVSLQPQSKQLPSITTRPLFALFSVNQRLKRHPARLLLHHDLQNVELSWPLGGLICRFCSDVSRNCLSLMTEPICPVLVTASILGKYSSLRSRMSFQNWPWYCFIKALPQTSRKSNSRVAVMSARGSMLSIWANQRQPWFRPWGADPCLEL